MEEENLAKIVYEEQVRLKKNREENAVKLAKIYIEKLKDSLSKWVKTGEYKNILKEEIYTRVFVIPTVLLEKDFKDVVRYINDRKEMLKIYGFSIWCNDVPHGLQSLVFNISWSEQEKYDPL